MIRNMPELPNIKRGFNKSVVFSDESPLFRRPFEPKANEEVTIRIRLQAGDTEEVFLIAAYRRVRMSLALRENDFDYFEAVIPVGESPLTYYFEIHIGDSLYFYDRLGVTHRRRRGADLRIVPGFSVPEWMQGAVIYQIYTDRFYRGSNGTGVESREYVYAGQRVKHIDKWESPVAELDVGNFYGGDLVGVAKKLDYLKELGVDAIYFNPLFVSPSNHKYDAQDYDHIDPHLTGFVHDGGDLVEEDASDNAGAERYRLRTTDPENLAYADAYFAAFVRAAHKRGIRVILDGVFNHCGSFNRWLNREGFYRREVGYAPGAYESKESPYAGYFCFQDKEAWPDNGSYEGWWDFDTLPKLNYDDSPKLVEEILRIAEKWVSPPYNCDGWRLDVAADLGHSPAFNHAFWQKFRERVKAANPEAVILAEHYGSARDWLSGNEWDTVMNYDAFMEPVTYFLTGMEKHSDSYHPELLGNGRLFFDTMANNQLVFMENSLFGAMNQLDNHDHSRFLTRTNHRVGRVAELGPEAAEADVSYPVMRAAVLIQMTWPGAPTLYYGDEAGVMGFTDPDCRRTYPWGHENKELLAFYQAAIALHHAHPVLKKGSYIELFAGSHIIAYGRFDGEEAVVTVVNSGEAPLRAYIPVRALGLSAGKNLIFDRALRTDDYGFYEKEGSVETIGSNLPLKMAPHEAVVLTCRVEKSH